MANITFQLTKGLKQYGLNPRDWQIQWVKPDLNRTDTKKQAHHLYIINQEDESIYFKAEAVLNKEEESFKAKWQSMQLASL